MSKPAARGGDPTSHGGAINPATCSKNVFIGGQPAATAASMHVCPAVTPGLPPVPHVGGPVVTPGTPNILINGMPVIGVGDSFLCAASPPAAVIAGSPNVIFGSKTAAGNASAAAGAPAEDDDKTPLTVKDFAGILTAIENDKQCYESARRYAAYHIDYNMITRLAKRYADETDPGRKEKEKDNDPNLMPSRYLLLYGADDGKLDAEGNLDSHHDGFGGAAEHKVSVANLRKALKLLGYGVEETGPFDRPLLNAFKKYIKKIGGADEQITEDEDDAEKPLSDLAVKYGVATWKFFYDKESGCDPGCVDHGAVMEKISADYGDQLLREKGGEPLGYRPAACYRYPWTPFRLKLTPDTEGQYKDAGYEIIDAASGAVLAEGNVVDDKMEVLLPDSEDVCVAVNGELIHFEPAAPEVVPADQIKEMFWSYGKNHKPLKSEAGSGEDDTRETKYYGDLNLHVVTESGNDGKIVKVTVQNDNEKMPLSNEKRKLVLNGAVRENNVVFANVFARYTLNQ